MMSMPCCVSMLFHAVLCRTMLCTAGIGLEFAKQLLQCGHEVIIACRDPQRAQAAVTQLQQHMRARGNTNNTSTATPTSAGSPAAPAAATISAVQCDLASLASVKQCAELVQRDYGQLDVLVCNAAVVPSHVTSLTADGFNEQLQVNHLSHVLLTHLLLPCLNRAAGGSGGSGGGGGSRIVVVGSELHRRVPEEWQDPALLQPLLTPPSIASQQQQEARQQVQQEQEQGQEQQEQKHVPTPALTPMQLYGVTKLCSVWFVRHLAQHILPAAGARVVANVVSPGFVPSTGGVVSLAIRLTRPAK